jgi:hypothetical protein
VRAVFITLLAIAVTLGLVAVIAILAIRALRRFVRAVWPHS